MSQIFFIATNREAHQVYRRRAVIYIAHLTDIFIFFIENLPTERKKGRKFFRKLPSPIVHVELYSRERNISHRGLSITLENYDAKTP